ncbi:MAG: carboxypeptidase-like regulatory domain-containing protein [Acidobacteriota bacterium]|nr:carboxypeptidase-like regulatory domain-containing protein [Acidobacteriota bacterium]
MRLSAIRVVVSFLLVAGLLGAQSAVPNVASGGQSQVRRAISVGAGVIRGTVKDGSGGVIPGAKVTLTDSNNATQTVSTGADGTYVFRGVAPGVYSVSATYTGLQQQNPLAVSVAPNQPATANIVMGIQTQKQEVTVTDTNTNTISTEAANNASALVLRQEDLDALPDDPDDLQADLTALAGPSAGPGGNQIFIDGFTGGRLPPKASIREIRINSNPFSAEFDKLGYGRIQIFTKPGSDKFHGQGYYNISDSVWNSRNPFLAVNPPFRTQLFGGNVSGPISKHASFFIDVERRNIDDNGIINATIPTSDFLNHFAYQNYYSTPQRRTTVSPRLDYQLSSNNTLSFRYSYLDNERIVTGIGAFDLPALTIGNTNFPSSGFSSSTTEEEFQAVDTTVLSPKAVNETHFQFDRVNLSEFSQSTAPQLAVSQSFVSGGSGYSAPGYPNSYDTQNNYELQNYTTLTWGAHTTKFGIRIRTDVLADSSPKGFNGTYFFLGGAFPMLDTSNHPIPGQTVQLQSIQQYLTTVQLLQTMSSQQVSALGYGPSKYTVNAGNPYLSFYQMDFGPFVQDDWRVRPNLTLSFGLRWESQTNINDKSDLAPRFGFAWSPDAKRTGRAKTVIRGGWGYFYDRFAIANVETAYRYNQQANSQTAYVLDNPNLYNAQFNTQIPISDLTNVTSNAAQRYQIDSSLKAPRLMQTAVSLERQLFSHTTLNANFINSRGTHEFRTVDINAPYPTPGELPPGSSQFAGGGRGTSNSNTVGLRPYGNIGDIYNFESDGIFKQTQVIVGVNSQVGKWLTLFSRFSYSNAHSDTDGLGTLPSNPYNFAQDWGRSILSIEENLFFGGSMTTKWGLRFSPFLVAHSGLPYNVTTGTDLFLQGQGAPTARPEVVNYATSYNSPFGYLNPDPVVSAPGTSNLIERNIATSPGFLGLNLRVSKTWGFGTTKFSGPSGGARAGGGGGGGGRGGGGGGRGGFGDSSTEHRYNLTLGVNARNILNHENLNTPNGALTSPYFLEATGITGGYGAEATASNQRRLDIQLRFAF